MMRVTRTVVALLACLALNAAGDDRLVPHPVPPFNNTVQRPLDLGEQLFLDQFLRDCSPEVRANLGDWMVRKWFQERGN